MTLEIIVFIASILFGIVWYWRESKSNSLYRFFNKLMHAKELQMKPENRKGFVHKQVFLMRLVWVTVVFALAATLVTLVTPINAFFVQYFVSAIVGTLIGTYIASLFFVASEGLTKENLEKVFDDAVEKGKDLVDDIKSNVVEEEVPTKEQPQPQTDEAPQKSARDRLKDKGMIN